MINHKFTRFNNRKDQSMYRVLLVITLLALSLMISIPARADNSFTFNFQGRLDGSDGNPVPDGNYQMMFSIYSDSVGGNLLWTESHPVIHTSGGFFGVDLGEANPCSLEIPTLQNLYIGMQIGTFPPLNRRLRITTSPQAGVARRIYGDLQTSPGGLLLRNPTDESQFHISSDSTGMSFGLKGPDGSDLFAISGKPGAIGKLDWGLFNPQPEPPGYWAHALMDGMTTPDGGASLVLNSSAPQPPGSDPIKLLELRNNVGGDGGIFMFNPQPEPPRGDPFFGLQSTLNGPVMNFYTPQMGGVALVNNHPQIRIRCDSTASRLLLQRARTVMGGGSDSTGMSMYADSVSSELKFIQGNNPLLRFGTNASGASMSFINNGSEYMGLEPSPWHNGGDINMFDAAGGQTLLLASNGMVSIGTGAHTNILTVKQNSATDPIADAWTTYSSRRWKTNIQPMQGALDKVMRLNGVTFDWKENGKHDIGLIAEDVGQVVPEVVKYEANGIDAQSVDYARLTALLIEAVKEQQKTIDELKSEISDIKASVNKQASSETGK
jgi:hypothetical protein